MSRVFFNATNNKVDEWSFQTTSSSATTFDPLVTWISGSNRVSWDVGDGSGYQATNSLSYSYSDSGSLKTVIVRVSDINRLSTFQGNADNITGEIDFSTWNNLGGAFTVNNNPALTGITHTYSPEIFTTYNVGNCNITGNLDVSMFPNLGGIFTANINPNLTSITHTASTQVFNSYNVNQTNITNLDVSMLTLGGVFSTQSCSNLTSITHSYSSQAFTNYSVNSCNLIGTHDLTMFPNLGGTLQLQSNSNLTGVTLTSCTNNFAIVSFNNCNLIGHLDMSMFSGYVTLAFQIHSNPNLTGVTVPILSGSNFNAYSCNLTGTIDLSNSSGLTSEVRVANNSNLENILFPPTTGTFRNGFTGNEAFEMNNCNFGYVDFNPLSGITMNTGSTYGASIHLQNNSMTAAEVNQILVDLDNITSASPSNWAGVVLDISGTNSAPDGSSGGFDGTTAKSNLIINGWTVTSN